MNTFDGKGKVQELEKIARNVIFFALKEHDMLTLSEPVARIILRNECFIEASSSICGL
jgi:hypothetical protein